MTSSGIKHDLDASLVIPFSMRLGLKAEIVPKAGKFATLKTRSFGFKYFEIA